MDELFQAVLADPSICKDIDDLVPRVNPQHDLTQLKLLIAEKKLDLHSAGMTHTWSGELAPHPRPGAGMSVSISLMGHESSLPWHLRWFLNIKRNLPTFVASLILGFLVNSGPSLVDLAKEWWQSASPSASTEQIQ